MSQVKHFVPSPVRFVTHSLFIHCVYVVYEMSDESYLQKKRNHRWQRNKEDMFAITGRWGKCLSVLLRQNISRRECRGDGKKILCRARSNGPIGGATTIWRQEKYILWRHIISAGKDVLSIMARLNGISYPMIGLSGGALTSESCMRWWREALTMKGAKFDPRPKMDFHWSRTKFFYHVKGKAQWRIFIGRWLCRYAESWFCTMPGIPKMTMPGIKSMCRPHVEKWKNFNSNILNIGFKNFCLFM